MPRGTKFWGNNSEAGILAKYLDEYVAMDQEKPDNEEAKAEKNARLGRFWSKVLKEIYNLLKTPEAEKEAKKIVS